MLSDRKRTCINSLGGELEKLWGSGDPVPLSDPAIVPNADLLQILKHIAHSDSDIVAKIKLRTNENYGRDCALTAYSVPEPAQ